MKNMTKRREAHNQIHLNMNIKNKLNYVYKLNVHKFIENNYGYAVSAYT